MTVFGFWYRRILSIWLGFWFCNYLLISFPFYVIFLSGIKWHPPVHTMNVMFVRILFFVCGIRLKVSGRNQIDRKKKYIYVSNHRSYFDIFSTHLAIPQQVRYMGKEELTKIPIFGYMFSRLHIPIDRKSKVNSYQSWIQAGEVLDEGFSVVMFPEGTIPKKTNVTLGEFKNGAFSLAIQKNIPIIPVTILGTKEILPDDKKFLFKPGRIHITFGEPIFVDGKSSDDVASLNKTVREIIYQNLI